MDKEGKEDIKRNEMEYIKGIKPHASEEWMRSNKAKVQNTRNKLWSLRQANTILQVILRN